MPAGQLRTTAVYGRMRDEAGQTSRFKNGRSRLRRNDLIKASRNRQTHLEASAYLLTRGFEELGSASMASMSRFVTQE